MQNEPSLRESSFGSSNPDGGASGYSVAAKKTTFYFIPVAILIAAIAIAGGIVYKYKNAPAPEAFVPEKSQPITGSEAPMFSLKTSREVEIKLEDLRWQNVLLLFWSTSCEYCAQELADLKQFTEKYRGQITVLAITYKETAQA